MTRPRQPMESGSDMEQTQTIPETFLGVGYTRDRAGLPLEAVRVPVPKPGVDQVLIRVAASSLNPLEYKLALLITFFGFVSSFLNSNSVTSALIYVFLSVPVLLWRYWIGRTARAE